MTIVIEPDPVIEGQPVTIKVDGPGPYEWGTFGDKWEPLPIDPETGEGRIIVPPGSAGGVLTVSDLDSDTHSVNINAPT
jgi:hypothetical protein